MSKFQKGDAVRFIGFGPEPSDVPTDPETCGYVEGNVGIVIKPRLIRHSEDDQWYDVLDLVTGKELSYLEHELEKLDADIS